MEIIYYLLIILALMLLSAFFSSAEIGIFSASRIRIQHMMESGVKHADTLSRMREMSHRTLTTILLGNTLVNIAASSVATALAVDLFGSWGVAIATGVMTFLILILCELIPKSYAVGNYKYAVLSSRMLQDISRLLFPFVWFTEKIASFVMNLLGLKREGKILMTEDEIKTIVDVGEEEGAILPEEKEMIQNVLEFNDIEVGEIMVHRTQIDALDIDSSDGEIRGFLSGNVHRFIPVYEGSLDSIKGVLSADALLRKLINQKVSTLSLREEPLMEPYFVPKTMQIDALFREMKKRKIKVAIVVDEYGGTAGIVKMSDVIEEIVGALPGESEEENIIHKIDKNTVIFPADTEIDEVGSFFGVDLEPDEDYRTLGGCIIDKLERLPNKGEYVSLGKFKFIAEEIRRHKIERVKVVRSEEEEKPQEAKL